MMAKNDVFNRLIHTIENVSNKKKLNQKQTNTIISLVEMIRTGDSLSDEKLIRYFEQIGRGN